MNIERWRNQVGETSIADMSFEEQEMRREVRPMPESMLTSTQRAALQEYIEDHLNGEHGQYEPQIKGKMDMDMIESLLLLDFPFQAHIGFADKIAHRMWTGDIYGHGTTNPTEDLFWKTAINRLAFHSTPEADKKVIKKFADEQKAEWEQYGHILTFLRRFCHLRIAYPDYYSAECKEWVDEILETEKDELIGMLKDPGTRVINPYNPHALHLRILSEEAFQMVMEAIPPDMATFRQSTEDMVRRGNWYEAIKNLSNLKVMEADRVLVTDEGVICDYGQIQKEKKGDTELPYRLKFQQ